MSQPPPSAAPLPGHSRYLEWHPETARRAIEAIADYDTMRVRTYQARTGNPEAIEVRSFGGATALQFPAVGYFNQVYQFREEDFGRLPEIKAFYAARGLAFKLLVAPDTPRDAVFAHLADEGFHVHETLVRVASYDLEEKNEPPPDGLVISAVPESEVDEFFRIYLTAFGADPAGHAAAIANMRLLHRQPSLRFLCGRFGSEVAGIAMLYVDGKNGVLCAGATIERTRGRGVQRALIRARIALAREAGCDLIVSWTELGSPSSENLAACGLAPIYVDPVWFFPAPDAPA